MTVFYKKKRQIKTVSSLYIHIYFAVVQFWFWFYLYLLLSFISFRLQQTTNYIHDSTVFETHSHTFVTLCGSRKIHTPTTEGISLRTPPPPRIFRFFEVSYNPPIPPNFPQYNKHPPPNPSGKFRSRRESF